jgi:hypothetical protein
MLNKYLLSSLLLGGLLTIAADKPAPGPHALVEAPSFDAGQVLSSQPVRHTYPVKNTGDAPLTIKDVKPG